MQQGGQRLTSTFASSNREHQHADGSLNWYPFNLHHNFNFAWYHFVECESSECEVNQGLSLWAASVLQFSDSPMWKSAMDLYNTIDQILHSDAPWRTYSFCYTGPTAPFTTAVDDLHIQVMHL